ncbi:PSI_PSAK domain-containing protein [Cephalotus follicularis]|uniref:Photosystem I reaction center subunit psaK, chloroplastic n=1 Tax=Cephalotus follicularis TaxID=3775 RepID=A0A1Q3C883_CEPFO|nr:PSI_PSAK domain-containing protein [Cephalotus follicularis]
MATTSMTTLSQFNGLRPNFSATPLKTLMQVAVQPMGRKGKGALGARCDYIGSPTNLIMVASTTLMLFAGRFGLAPSANRKATAGLKLEARDSGLQTGDPAGFTLADTLACGSVGHIIGVGVVLGLKNIGAL